MMETQIEDDQTNTQKTLEMIETEKQAIEKLTKQLAEVPHQHASWCMGACLVVHGCMLSGAWVHA